MKGIDSKRLDEHITGHYGEDQFQGMRQGAADLKVARLMNKAPTLWHPSTDIRAAWDLVEEMNKTCRVDVITFKDGGVNIVVRSIEVPTFTIRADTVPEGICQAYLAWKEAST